MVNQSSVNHSRAEAGNSVSAYFFAHPVIGLPDWKSSDFYHDKRRVGLFYIGGLVMEDYKAWEYIQALGDADETEAGIILEQLADLVIA